MIHNSKQDSNVVSSGLGYRLRFPKGVFVLFWCSTKFYWTHFIMCFMFFTVEVCFLHYKKTNKAMRVDRWLLEVVVKQALNQALRCLYVWYVDEWISPPLILDLSKGLSVDVKSILVITTFARWTTAWAWLDVTILQEHIIVCNITADTENGCHLYLTQKRFYLSPLSLHTGGPEKIG